MAKSKHSSSTLLPPSAVSESLGTNTDAPCWEIHSGPFKNSSTVISSHCATFTVNTIHLMRPQMRISAVAGTKSVTCHLWAGPADRRATPVLSSIYGEALSASVMTRGPEAELAEPRSVCESRLVSDWTQPSVMCVSEAGNCVILGDVSADWFCWKKPHLWLASLQCVCLQMSGWMCVPAFVCIHSLQC